jgi:hypothetical protein
MSEREERGASLAADGDDGWAEKRQRRFTFALAASPAERLAWLEQMIALAWQTGALPRPRNDVW